MLRERIITIDLDEGNYRILRYKQYDNNQILKIIIQENKEEVDLAFYTARLFFKLPSGSILEKDTTIENNRIIVSIDSGILSENGRIIADLTLSSSEQLVTAFTMYLDVEETIDRNEAVQSKPEWDLITNTLNNLDTKVDKVEGKSLIANSEIERLANVDNYDDTELRNLIDTKSDTTHNHDTQYASKSSEHIHDNKNALDKVTDSKVIEWDNKSDFSGSYEDLTDKPTIPVVDVNKVYVDEQLSNKSDINHTHTELHTHNNKDVLDVITQEKINEWNSKSDFSGDYNDLINKPIIPTLDGYATENYVKNAIADAQLNGGGGSGSVDLSGYATKDELNAKANVSDIPTKTSQLENDSRFLTSVPSEYVTESELNAKGYLTQHQDISGKVDKVNGKSLISNSEIERLANMEDNANNYVHPSTHKASMIVEDNTHRFITDLERVNWNNKVESSQLHEHSNKDVLNGISSEKVTKWDKAEENVQSDWNTTDTTSDAYIKNKPSIPSKVSELTNDNLYATETYVRNKIAEAQVGGGVDLSEYALKVDLNEKVDKVSGKGLSTNDYTNEEKNKLSNLSTVATSGNYNDLTNKPSIPTKTSQLTNDSSFASESYVTNAINNAQLGGGDGSSIDLSAYQTKSDNTLTTDSKTIVGAINELDTKSIKSVDYSTIDTTIGNDVSNRLTELETKCIKAEDYENSSVIIENNLTSRVSVLETNKADKTYVDEQISNVSIDLSVYQTKSDDTLTTDAKTIVGAINELDTNKTDKTYVDQQISNINTELAEVKQSVSNGKSLIASAITDKGIETLSDATFQTMADNIGLIESGGSNLPSWYEGWSSSPTDAPISMSNGMDVANNKIYYMYKDNSYCYDANNNTWETKTPMPTSRGLLNLITVDDKIYCFGGEISSTSYSTDNECYDPLTDSWTTKGKVINNYYLMSKHPTVSYNHKLYYLGYEVFCYDTISDTWTKLGKSGFYGDNGKITRAMASVVNGIAYVFGGFRDSFATSAFNCYDISTDTWSSLDNMPIARESGSTCTVNDKIYIMGGHNTTGNLNDNKLYDPSTNTWEDKESMLTARGNFKLNLIDDIIYAVGGGTLNECYTVAENLKSGSGGTCGDIENVRSTLAGLMKDGGYDITGEEDINSLLELLTVSGIALDEIKQIACGYYHTFILKTDGSLWTSGYNENGQLGLPDSTQKTIFTQVTTNINNDVKQVACGYYHTFIIKNDGSLWSCGYNNKGQLGLGDTTQRTRFTQVTTNINNDVKQVVCGSDITFIIKTNGSVWSCGNNEYGQLGLNDVNNRASFTQVTANINNDVKQIICGGNFTFILKTDGSVWSCGNNNYGQLGLGDFTNRGKFTQVPNINDIKQIACGNYHTFILKNDNSVWSCGNNNYGHLGLGDASNRNIFTKITTNTNNDVKQVVCGNCYTFIIKTDNSVWSCGQNNCYQLGLGNDNNKASFNQVTTNINNDVKQVTCGSYFTFIIKTDGSIYACGYNDYGQLGLVDIENRATFTQIPKGF